MKEKHDPACSWCMRGKAIPYKAKGSRTNYTCSLDCGFRVHFTPDEYELYCFLHTAQLEA